MSVVAQFTQLFNVVQRSFAEALRTFLYFGDVESTAQRAFALCAVSCTFGSVRGQRSMPAVVRAVRTHDCGTLTSNY